MINYKISTLIWGKYDVYCHAELTRKSVEYTKPDFLFLLGDSVYIKIDFGS